MAKQNPHVVAAFHNDITKSRGTKNMLQQTVGKVPIIIYSTENSVRIFIQDDKTGKHSMSELKALLKESNI